MHCGVALTITMTSASGVWCAGWGEAREGWRAFVRAARSLRELSAALLVFESACKSHVKCAPFLNDVVDRRPLTTAVGVDMGQDPGLRYVLKLRRRKARHLDDADVAEKNRRKQGLIDRRNAIQGWDFCKGLVKRSAAATAPMLPVTSSTPAPSMGQPSARVSSTSAAAPCMGAVCTKRGVFDVTTPCYSACCRAYGRGFAVGAPTRAKKQCAMNALLDRLAAKCDAAATTDARRKRRRSFDIFAFDTRDSIDSCIDSGMSESDEEEPPDTSNPASVAPTTQPMAVDLPGQATSPPAAGAHPSASNIRTPPVAVASTRASNAVVPDMPSPRANLRAQCYSSWCSTRSPRNEHTRACYSAACPGQGFVSSGSVIGDVGMHVAIDERAGLQTGDAATATAAQDSVADTTCYAPLCHRIAFPSHCYSSACLRKSPPGAASLEPHCGPAVATVVDAARAATPGAALEVIVEEQTEQSCVAGVGADNSRGTPAAPELHTAATPQIASLPSDTAATAAPPTTATTHATSSPTDSTVLAHTPFPMPTHHLHMVMGCYAATCKGGRSATRGCYSSRCAGRTFQRDAKAIVTTSVETVTNVCYSTTCTVRTRVVGVSCYASRCTAVHNSADGTRASSLVPNDDETEDDAGATPRALRRPRRLRPHPTSTVVTPPATPIAAVGSKKRKGKKPITCRNCGAEGHNRQTCRQPINAQTPSAQRATPTGTNASAGADTKSANRRRSARQPKAVPLAFTVEGSGTGDGPEGAGIGDIAYVPTRSFSCPAMVAWLQMVHADDDDSRGDEGVRHHHHTPVRRGLTDLPAPLLRVLARRAGGQRLPCISYKAAHAAPTFRQIWRTQVGGATSVSALMMQLRILDASVRWDAMKAPSAKRQVSRSVPSMRTPRSCAMYSRHEHYTWVLAFAKPATYFQQFFFL